MTQGADLSAADGAGSAADGGRDATGPPDVERLYAEHATRVLAVVVALRGTRVGPEDVVQEAFLRAHQRWHEVSTMARPELWVQRVALNLATSRLRRLGSEARALARLGGRAREPLTETFAQEQDFWRLVRRLPAKQAHVVVLRYAADLAVADIARVTGTAEGTVKAQLHAARRRLAVLVSDPEQEQRG